MIQGYPGRASVAPGERLRLHVSTDAARFRINIHRWGDGLVPMVASAWLPGRFAAAKGPADDWQWPEHDIAIPANWPSGVYLAHLEEPGEPRDDRLHIRMNHGAALFVVRGSGRSDILYKIPLATYHAYNRTGGGCFYINPTRSDAPPGSKVSLRRPGGGIGGETHGAVDYYDMHSPRQTFAHWDAPFIRWLVRAGYQPEFCTDIDIHQNAGLSNRYRLLLSVGHDEYWSATMRERVEDFIEHGGNVAFFGANICWWRIHLVDDDRAMVCHQGGPQGALDHWWTPTGANRPEDGLTGVSYRHGGGLWDGPRRSTGYAVQQPEHWVFRGTGVRRGETFGKATSPPLVGYECDGAPLERSGDEPHLFVVAPRAQRHGTPAGFQALAVGLLDAEWQELPPREGYPERAGIHSATMGIYSRNGTVFTAATTDWAQALTTGQDSRIEQITRNVIDRLSRG